MSDRHEKWEQVPPGTVIPAGQPYRVERWDTTFGARATEYVDDKPHEVRPRDYPVFIDSSWKPPLVLPTTPTWGIAVHQAGSFTDQWFTVPERPGRLINGRGAKLYAASVLDFIPLTEEQVARIEAAR